MRSTRLLISIVVVGAAASLGPGGCSCNSSSSGSPHEQENNDAASDDSGTTDDSSTPTPEGGSEASTPVEAGSSVPDSGTPDSGTTFQEAGGGSDGAIPPPTTMYQACPDLSPGNTTFQSAYALTLDSTGFVDLSAGVVPDSDEWFKWSTVKHDPVHVWASYTVPSGSTNQLSLEDKDIGNNYLAEDDTTRSTASQTLDTYFESTAAGNFYSDISLSSSDTAPCQNFDYYVDALFCTDQYEDNDTEQTPAALTFTKTAYAAPTTWATATVSTSGATINDLDPDYYSVVAPLHDPMSASVTYTEPSGETAQLSLEVYDSTDNYQGEDDTTRTTSSQTLNVVWEPEQVGCTPGACGTYILYVSSGSSVSDGTCSANAVTVNGLWCTDNYEDNDTISTPSALPDTSTTPATATITSLDPDYYTLPAASQTTTGSCTVTYTIPTTSNQELSVEVYDTTQSYNGEDDSPTMTASTATTNTWTLTVDWTSTDYATEYVYVSANQQDCTTYTISCTSN